MRDDKIRYDIPEDVVIAIDNYVFNRIRPCGFLLGALANDFLGAVCSADDRNAEKIANIARYIYMTVPMGILGSYDKVERHLSVRPLRFSEQSKNHKYRHGEKPPPKPKHSGLGQNGP